MKIFVFVKPHARQTMVETLPDGTFAVSVTAPAAEGQANGAVIEALAEHFGVALSRVRIAHGVRGRRKTVEIA